ncbi:MAG TPA: SMC-Scp complex subunit ScpB [Steroidobacteraceae bacterium]|nr:SMC-Scp complex subunit ScpB [Steroidobacteraceae bacterium]
MNEVELKHLIEATLLAAGRPVSTDQLAELFDERSRPTREEIRRAIAGLEGDYADRGIEVLEVASGWRIQVRPRCIDVVSRLWQERPSRYSRALLETLALIAYRQPITRSEIEEIRGVSVSSTIMRTLQERNWIRVVGHREVPGRPELLGTTREFLDYFGLRSLDELPTLAELRDVETIGVQLELPGGGEAGADTGEPTASPEQAASDQAPAAGESQGDAEHATQPAPAIEEPSEESDETHSAADDSDPERATLVASAADEVSSDPILRAPSAENER